MVNILVCEDEGLIAREIETTLQNSGYNVVGRTGSGEEALELLKQRTADLALMDINLSGELNGIETAKIFREKYNLPVIFLTAYGDRELLARAKETQPIGYMLKPFKDRELYAMIETTFHNFQEQSRKINKLELEVEEAYDDMQNNTEVQYERESVVSEKNNAFAKMLNNFATYLTKDLNVTCQQLELLKNPQSLSTEGIRNIAQFGMLHQQSVLSLLGVLSKLSDKNQLTMQKDLVDEVIIEAINKFPALGQGAVQFTKNFYPTPLYAWTNKNLLIETLNHVFFSFLQTSGNNLINVMTSLAFEGYPERFNAESEPGWYVQIKIANAGGAENLQARDSKYLGGTAFIIVNDIVQRHGGWLRTNSDGELEKNASIYLPERELTRQF